MRQYQWSKGPYIISTDPSKIPLSKLSKAMASTDFYWANPVPEDILRETLQNSLCFGVFEESEFIGFGRCITDFTTFLYLTDVYMWPSHQGKGIGKWLINCIQEVIEDMPYLRRSMLFTGDWKRSVPFYEKLMGMKVLEAKRTPEGGEGLAILMRNGRGHPDYQES